MNQSPNSLIATSHPNHVYCILDPHLTLPSTLFRQSSTECLETTPAPTLSTIGGRLQWKIIRLIGISIYIGFV